MEDSTEGVWGVRLGLRPYKGGDELAEVAVPWCSEPRGCSSDGDTVGDVAWLSVAVPAAASRRSAAASLIDLASAWFAESAVKVHIKVPRSRESMRLSQMGQP